MGKFTQTAPNLVTTVTSDDNDVIDNVLHLFTKVVIANVIKSNPQIVAIIKAELEPRLASTTVVDGITYGIKSASQRIADLIKSGNAVAKKAGKSSSTLAIVEETMEDINPETAGGACWLSFDDANTFKALDAWLEEVGVKRSRGSYNGAGIWGMKDNDELV